MIPLIIVTGPTTSKKSQTAVALAQEIGGEIINADSMQVYKYFDIGTAKPTPEEKGGVPHHLIDILEPDEPFTAFDFKVRALQHAEDLIGRNKVPIIVGGTGLYLKVLTQDYDCAIRTSSEIQNQVREEIREQGPRAMHEKLRHIDPQAAAGIEPTDPVRIERALAVYRETGKKLSDYHETDAPSARQWPIHCFLLEWDRQNLYANIDRRVDAMIEAGLVDEVQNILDRGYARDIKPLRSIGYAQVVRHLAGEIDLERAVYEIKRDTRHYAKRQITWFKKAPEAIPVSANTEDTGATLKGRILSLLPQGVSFLLALTLGLSSPNTAQASAVLEEGLRLFQQEQYEKSGIRFQELLNTSAEPVEKKRALYLLGRAQAAQGNHAEAAVVLEKSLLEYPEIEDYIRFDLAQAYLETGNTTAALKHIQALSKNFPQSTLLFEAIRVEAEILKKENKTAEAIQALEQVIQKISNSPRNHIAREYLPEMIFSQAQLLSATGKHQDALENYRKLYIDYPAHKVMIEAEPEMKRLQALPRVTFTPWTLDEQGDRVAGLLKDVRFDQVITEIQQIQKKESLLPGRFYFYLATAQQGLRRRDLANQALLKFLKLYPQHSRASEARFEIGRNLWNLGSGPIAIQYFQKVLKENPSSEWGIKSLFFTGRIYEEDLKSLAQAKSTYAEIIDRYGNDEYAQWSAWRLGWLSYLEKDYAQSFDKFQNAANLYPQGFFVESNLYWSAKASEKLQRKEEAHNLYRQVYERYPYTYYGVRSREVLADLPPPDQEDAAQKPDSSATEDKPSAAPNLESDSENSFHYSRAVELTAMRLYPGARLEIRQLEQTVRKNLTGVLWLSSLFNEAQGYADTLRILHLYSDFTTKSREKDLPLKFWKNFFPLAYTETIHDLSRKYKVDPYFVKALIRQESLFDAQSLSRAGAIGLMQIMPDTGKRLYRPEKNGKAFESNFLFDPDMNIQLGVKYLSQLRERFGKNSAHTLISYNAGPDVLKKWLRRFADLNDPDVFVESIPYPETRRYVKHVKRNYGVYKILYPDLAGKK